MFSKEIIPDFRLKVNKHPFHTKAPRQKRGAFLLAQLSAQTSFSTALTQLPPHPKSSFPHPKKVHKKARSQR